MRPLNFYDPFNCLLLEVLLWAKWTVSHPVTSLCVPAVQSRGWFTKGKELGQQIHLGEAGAEGFEVTGRVLRVLPVPLLTLDG